MNKIVITGLFFLCFFQLGQAQSSSISDSTIFVEDSLLQEEEYEEDDYIPVSDTINLDNYQRRPDVSLPQASSMDKDLWKQLSDNQDFSKNKEKKAQPKIPSKDIKVPQWQPSFNMSVLKYVFIFLLLGVLIWQSYLAFKRMQNKTADQIEDLNVEIENIENELTHANVDSPLHEAIRNGWLAQALRLYHLKILQLMDKNNYVQWQKHKTNRQYGYEIKNEEIRQKYFQTTHAYEKFWFGKALLDNLTFKSIESEYLKLIDKISRYAP